MADSETMTLVDAIEYIRNDEAHAAAMAGLKEIREVLRDLKRGPVGREGSCWCTGAYYKPPRVAGDVSSEAA